MDWLFVDRLIGLNVDRETRNQLKVERPKVERENSPETPAMRSHA